ncbi:MAG TPA: histidinol dehydrogenase [Alphaproteobacteria bacterium]|nr:histidinol dehydrogenase [Alphaproteobacteria bacterium]
MVSINIWRWGDLDKPTREKILSRAQSDIEAATQTARAIIEDVKARGDDALRDYARKFDKAEVKNLKASDAEFDAAYKALAPDVIASIKFCAQNVKIHHEQQMQRVEDYWLDEVIEGVYAGEKVTPVASAGLYVPRGKGAFPSVMYMLATPAKVAGVPQIVVVTPPTPDGGVDAASLVAADICGVRDVYKVGGAQAIAALAYGTETVPKVSIVQGPGSPYVAAAKRLLSGVINPGMAAGPSEALVLADGSADPHNTALDLINEAEHGPDSASVLVTPDEELARRVAALLPAIIESLPEPRRSFCATVFGNYGGIILARDMNEAIEVTNLYAVEHMLLKVAEPQRILPQIKNSGEILIGEATPIVMGNFGIGVNAVLPTGAQALSSSCTSVWSFLKRTSLAYCTATGYAALEKDVTRLADYEGFPGHAEVIRKRNPKAFKDLPLPGVKKR